MFVAAITYLNIHLENIGISATRIGFITSFSRALAIIIMPIWGIIADYLGANKKVLMITLSGTIVFLLSFLTTEVFMVVFIIYIFYFIFESPLIPLSDSLLLNHLEEKSNTYGRFRVWGSIGYMIAIIPFGYIIEQTHSRNLFFLASGTLFIALMALIKLPESNKDLDVASITDFKMLFKNKKLFLFLVFTFLIQVPLTANYTFFPIFFTHTGGGETLLGIGMLISAGSELIIFQKSDKFFEKFNFKLLFTISAGFFALRWFLIALFPTPEILLFTQLFHGITYALFHVTAVYFISKIVGDNFKATGQNLYASTVSIAIVFSGFLGGVIYDNLGGARLYLIGGLIAVLAGLGSYLNILIKTPKTN